MKKVLIITYYWPPSGGSGVQRWVKLSKYLTRGGVECHVLTVDSKVASYMSQDLSLLEDIDEKVKVYQTNSFEPINIYSKIVGSKNVPTAGFTNVDNSSLFQKVINFIRSNLFIPDPRIGWNKYAYKKAVEIIKKHKISTVITTSPPHSTQLIGRKLKRKLQIYWIADLRDPWTDIYYYPILRHSKLSHLINLRKEKSVIEEADKVVSVSEGCIEIFKNKTPKNDALKFEIIHNGFDLEDFQAIKKKRTDPYFRIVYTGLMSLLYSPEIFFKALETLPQEIKNKLEIHFVGQISEEILKRSKSSGVKTISISTVPHDEVLQHQINADLLLLVIPEIKNDKGVVTGKIFEYIATGNPILGIGPKDGDAGKILKTNTNCKMFDREDIKPIQYFILSQITNYNNLKPESNTHTGLNFSRKVQAEKYSKLIK